MVGKAIAEKFNIDTHYQSLSSKIIIDFGLGLSAIIIMMTILGFFGLLKIQIIWVLLLLFLLFGLITHKPVLNISSIKSSLNSLKIIEIVTLFIIVIISGLYLTVSLSPTLDGDSLASYLLLSREYANNSIISVVDYAIGSSFPQNGQLINTLGLLFKDQIVAQLLIVWSMGILCVLIIYSIGRTFCSRQVTLIGILIWYGTYSVAFLAQSAKIDITWAAFDLLALYVFMQWYFSDSSKGETKLLFLAGFFLGIAGGVKQASFYTIILLMLAITFRLFGKKEHSIITLIKSYSAFLIPASIAGIWVIRSYLLTGEFVFTGRSFQNNHGILGFFQTLWRMSMLGNAVSLEGAMGKSIGPSILALVPIIFFFKNVDRRVWHILGYCGLMLILWYNGVQRARHLLPTIALLSLVAGYVVHLLISQKPKFGYTVLILVFFSIGLNLSPWVYVNFISTNRFGYILGQHNLDEYLKENLTKRNWYPNYDMTIKIRDKLPSNVKIAALSTGNSYYLDKPFYGAKPTLLAPAWTQDSLEYPDPQDFYNELIDSGITHVFINDYVVKNWGLEKALLNQHIFKDKYLKKIIAVDGQHLYVIKGE